MADLNISRLFAAGEADLEKALASVAPDVKAGVSTVVAQLKTAVTGVVAALDPNLASDVAVFETTLEGALTTLTAAKLGPEAASLEAAEVNPVVQAIGNTALNKISAWISANTK